MKRSEPSHAANQVNYQELIRQTAIHEAGHAVAIYLGNRQKLLPPVFFQIVVKKLATDSPRYLSAFQACGTAKVEGGRLIHTLPSTIEEATHDFSPEQKQAYQQAFEADIVNLLVGPLAEARYIAWRDDEVINARLVNLNALRYYGGTSDLDLAGEYLECFIADREQRENKIGGLFMEAFAFINDASNWRAITVLADYILASPKTIIECEEVMALLDGYFI
ncbi:hypothetical protein [Methylobacter sp. BBA5.1]|uniref:hypothetical protein n=1 Tax=Methylobacter sp. BBA5.1 TaxID=1495064 RepID=UPI00055B4DFF|nr:hypothetical protein [Methylobacter sp. BBA5.1]